MRLDETYTAGGDLAGREQKGLGTLGPVLCHNVCGKGLDAPVDEEAGRGVLVDEQT